jgi:carbamoyl-phosphate synthase large subunit
MKSVGEAMAIGRTFKEAFLKGIRSLELGKTGRLFTPIAKDEEFDEAALRKKLVVPTDRRMWAVFEALNRGWTTETIHDITKIDPWFLQQFADIVALKHHAEQAGLDGLSADELLTLKRSGFGDQEIAGIVGVQESAVREKRLASGSQRLTSASTRARRSSSRSPLHAARSAVLRVGAEREEEGRDPRQRPEPDRPGHRVRLLLLSRRLRPRREASRR